MANVRRSGSDGNNTRLQVDGEDVVIGRTTNSNFMGKWFVHFKQQGRVLIVDLYDESSVIRALEDYGTSESKWHSEIWDIKSSSWNVYD